MTNKRLTMPEQKADIMNNKGLTIEIGRENQYVVEDITKEKIDSSFFASQYRESLAAVESYLKHLPASSDNNFEESVTNDYPNNIIAFVGDRGSGKTSCMESVAKFLANPKKDVTDYKTITSTKFYALDLIDPAFFDDEHNIVSLVIANLYSRFTENDKDLHNPNHDDNIKLYHQFAKVQNELECILNKSSKDVDELDKLTSLSNTVSLKHDMLKLVNLFLKYMGKEDGILLLHIDDIDLNTQRADEMMESIRKYLILPNILILMSAKVEQLENVKQLAYVKEYKSLLDKEGRTGFTHENVKEMVDKFITKLLPHVQRIHMPELSDNDETPLTIKDKDIEIGFYTKWWNAVPGLIKEKTGIAFYSTNGEINRIVPRNLRDFCQFVRLINDMNAGEDIVKNENIFTNYLLNDWAKKRLSAERFDALEVIKESTKYINFNKIVAEQLYKVFKNTIDDWRSEIEDNKYAEACAIVDRYNKPNMVTMGDVFGVVSLLEDIHHSNEDKDFFFLVKFVYTSLLLSIKFHSRLGLNPAWYENGNLNPKLKNYRNLIGGNFINSTIIETMPTEGSSGIKRSMRKIDLSNFRAIAKEEIEENDINKLHLLEIFVLCMGRNSESKYDNMFRKREDVEYDKDLQDVKEAYFDINSYMYNVIDLDTAYKRMGEEFYECVKNNNDSLYNKLLRLQQHTNFAFEDVLITNSEILMLIMRILSNHKTYKRGFVYNLWAYFDRFSDETSYLIDGAEYEINNIIGCSDIAKILKPLRQDNTIEELAQRIISSPADDRIISIDKLTILQNDEINHASSQIKKSIISKHPFFKETKNKEKLDKLFPPRKRFSKDEIKKKVDKYNKEIKEEE